MASWVTFPSDGLWDLVTSEWFEKPAWRQVWDWVLKRRAGHHGAYLVDLLAAHRELGIQAMEAVSEWSETVTLPAVTLPALRQAVEQRKVLGILSDGLRRDPEDGDVGDWTVERLLAERQARDAMSDLGATAAVSATEILDHVLGIAANDPTKAQQGISTGFRVLDNRTMGLWPKEVDVIAGRPGVGKTTLALNMVANIAGAQRKPVAYFSFEMSRQQITFILVAIKSGIPVRRLMSGPLRPEEISLLNRVTDEIYHWPLRIFDTPMLLPDLRQAAQRLRQDGLLDVCFVDYLQRIPRNPASRENETDAISGLSRELSAMSGQLSIPVVLLSSLSRNVESRSTPEPMLGDLRSSGQIEHDLSKAFMLYKPTSAPVVPPGAVAVGCSVPKVRMGGIVGISYLALWPDSQRMQSIEGGEDFGA